MGDRGQVHIKDSGVWLYTHWEATELVDTVKSALSKKWRWHDDQYLARIIFDEMTKGKSGEETGFGIGTHEIDPWRIVEIDCDAQLVTVTDHCERGTSVTFDEFIK